MVPPLFWKKFKPEIAQYVILQLDSKYTFKSV